MSKIRNQKSNRSRRELIVYIGKHWRAGKPETNDDAHVWHGHEGFPVVNITPVMPFASYHTIPTGPITMYSESSEALSNNTEIYKHSHSLLQCYCKSVKWRWAAFCYITSIMDRMSLVWNTSWNFAWWRMYLIQRYPLRNNIQKKKTAGSFEVPSIKLTFALWRGSQKLPIVCYFVP